MGLLEACGNEREVGMCGFENCFFVGWEVESDWWYRY